MHCCEIASQHLELVKQTSTKTYTYTNFEHDTDFEHDNIKLAFRLRDTRCETKYIPNSENQNGIGRFPDLSCPLAEWKVWLARLGGNRVALVWGWKGTPLDLSFICEAVLLLLHNFSNHLGNPLGGIPLSVRSTPSYSLVLWLSRGPAWLGSRLHLHVIIEALYDSYRQEHSSNICTMAF